MEVERWSIGLVQHTGGFLIPAPSYLLRGTFPFNKEEDSTYDVAVRRQEYGLRSRAR